MDATSWASTLSTLAVKGSTYHNLCYTNQAALAGGKSIAFQSFFILLLKKEMKINTKNY